MNYFFNLFLLKLYKWYKRSTKTYERYPKDQWKFLYRDKGTH